MFQKVLCFFSLFMLSSCFLLQLLDIKKEKDEHRPTLEKQSKVLKKNRMYTSGNLDYIEASGDNIEIINKSEFYDREKRTQVVNEYMDSYNRALSYGDEDDYGDSSSEQKFSNSLRGSGLSADNFGTSAPFGNVKMIRRLYMKNKMPVPVYMNEYFDDYYTYDKESIETQKEPTFLEQKKYALKGDQEQQRNIYVKDKITAAGVYDNFNSKKFVEQPL